MFKFDEEDVDEPFRSLEVPDFDGLWSGMERLVPVKGTLGIQLTYFERTGVK